MCGGGGVQLPGLHTIIMYTQSIRLARVDAVGISCYSSADLLNWRNEGVMHACWWS